jgi:glutamate 5-kinase
MLENKNRIIIKIGSNLLVKDGSVRSEWLKTLVDDIAYLVSLKKEVIIVSSGAIALGKKAFKKQSDLSVREKQAACSVGQIELMSCYQDIFAKKGLTAAQILLTSLDSSNRGTYLNARNTFLTLIQNDVIAIVNENDTVATEEIRIGDNDRLAARVAQMVDGDLLILLSDIDGLYDKNPQVNKDANFIALIENIDKKIEDMASNSISNVGSGGMVTKIKAAKMAFNAGCDTIITSGMADNPIKKLLEGARHSLFKTNKKKMASKKQWIVDDFNARGELIINDRAIIAINKGSSLLPVGVNEVKGRFEEGDNIMVKDTRGNHIATGTSSYSSGNAKLIIGKKTDQIKEIFGPKIKEELVHRDNMVTIS